MIGAALWLVIATGAFAENWDRFRGPNGAGQSDDNSIPSTWTVSNFLWKQPLPGIGHSSPVIWDDKLFLTWAEKGSGAQVVAAYDVRTGSPLWQKKFEATTYHINDLNSLSSSTPALDADRLYFMWLQDGKVMLVALTHTGDEVWRREVGGFKETHGFGQSPIVVGNLVYASTVSGADSAITAFDSRTGDVRWKVPRPSGTTSFATPCLLDTNSPRKILLADSTESGIAAIDAESGDIVWQGFKDELTQRCVSSPIVAGGLVFVGCGQGGNGKLLFGAPAR